MSAATRILGTTLVACAAAAPAHAGITLNNTYTACFDGPGTYPANIEDFTDGVTSRAIESEVPGANAVCYTLTVTCDSSLALVGTRTVGVKQTDPPSAPIGNVLLVTGEYGTAWYGASDEDRFETVKALVDAGYRTFEVKWDGTDGFLTDSYGAGLRQLTCGLNEIATWLEDQHFEPDVPACAAGNSIGGSQIGMLLAWYGAESHLTSVVLSAGPSTSTMHDLCFAPIHREGTTLNLGSSGLDSTSTMRVLVDKLMGWYDANPATAGANWCRNYADSTRPTYGVLPPSLQQALIKKQSLVSTGVGAESRDYDTTTDQFQVVYDGDFSGAEVQAGVYNAQTSVYGQPAVVVLPSGDANCADAADDDGDSYVNDGCVAVGNPETGLDCLDSVDAGEDAPADGVVNDGCPGVGPHMLDATPDGSQEIVDLLLQSCVP